MSAARFSGPWKHVPIEKNGEHYLDRIVDSDGAIVVNDVTRAECAPLVATAPKLLAALKGAIGALEQDYDAGKDMGDADWEGIAYERLQAARVAIAEAEAAGVQ